MRKRTWPFYSCKAGRSEQVKCHRTRKAALAAAGEMGQIWLTAESRQRQVHWSANGSWMTTKPDPHLSADLRGTLVSTGVIAPDGDSDAVAEGEYVLQKDELQMRVWLHGPDGSTVARFDTRFGMDIHASVTEQMKGASQCLHCTHTKPTLEDWEVFRSKIKDLFAFDIPADAVAIR